MTKVLDPLHLLSLQGAWTTTSMNTNGTIEYYRNATSGQIVTHRIYNNLSITGSSQTKTWTTSGNGICKRKSYY
jgi:hypothetical protein